MTNRNTPHRFAGTAIAAFLALSSTSVLAQEAPAPADTMTAEPAAQSAPTIVLPPIAVRPALVIEAAPVQAATAPRAAAPRAVARTATARPVAAPVSRTAPAASAPVSAPVAREATAPVADTAPIAPIAETDALPADLAGQPVATAEPASNDNSNDLLLAGLVGALGLGAIGLFAATHRRRSEPEDSVVEYEPVSEPVEPAAEAPQRYATLAAPAFTPLKSWSEPRVPQAQPSDSSAPNLNRAALIDRMVAAEPDANNPFTTAKARRHRARLMLQSMESDRWDDAELAPGFDWREMAHAVEERETVQA